MLRIGVKFCGGCHPAYDRIEAFSMIKNELQNQAQFISYEDTDADLILVVMGCPSACVDTKDFEQHRLRIVKSFTEAEAFISEVREFNKK